MLVKTYAASQEETRYSPVVRISGDSGTRTWGQMTATHGQDARARGTAILAVTALGRDARAWSFYISDDGSNPWC